MATLTEAARFGGRARSRRVTLVAGVAATAVGVTAMAGWCSGTAALTRLGLAGAPIVPNSSAALLLLAAAMLLIWRGRYGALTLALAAVVSVSGGITLAEYLFGFDVPGWDKLLLPAGAMSRSAHPGRMAAPTAAAFLVFGAAIILLRGAGRGRAIAAQWLTIAAAIVLVTTILAGAYGAHPVFQKPPYTPVAEATALTLMVCAAGILSLRPLEGWLAVVTARGAGGHAVRVFLSISAIVPAVLGAIVLRLDATRRDVPFAVAVLVCSTALALAVAALSLSLRLHHAVIAAEESDRRYRSLFNANNVGVATWDFHGHYTDVNDAFLEIVGRSREEVVGRRALRRDVTAPESHQADERALEQLRATGRCEVYLKEFVRADNTRRSTLAAGSLLSGAADEGIGVYVDVTERVRAEEQLRHANEILQARLDDMFGTTGGGAQTVEALARRLADANAELESFAYSVSHDLRAPLRSIDGFANELLLGYSAALDARGQHYLARIRAAAGRMSDLIDALLQLSRIGRATLKVQAVDLSDLAKRVAADIAEQWPRTDFDVAPQLHVRGDLMLLRVALDNLLRNAAKFSAMRTRPCVEVGVTQEDGRTVYFVRDNGVGFDMQYAERLFSPFQRLHSAAEFPGTGVGLAIVSRIVQRHGGRVWASAAPERGATFFFTLGDPDAPHPAG